MSRGLFCLAVVVAFVPFLHADPRHPLPNSPSEIWQNDLDLRDDIQNRLEEKGVTDGSDADAGDHGQYISSVTAATAFPATGQWGDLVEIDLTAGDWLVTVVASVENNSGNLSAVDIGVSTTAGNDSTGLVLGDSYIVWADGSALAGTAQRPFTVPSKRFSLSSDTTVYLKYFASYSSGAPRASGRISAERIR